MTQKPATSYAALTAADVIVTDLGWSWTRDERIEACYAKLVSVLAGVGFGVTDQVEGRALELTKPSPSIRLHLQRWQANQVRAVGYKKSVLLSTEMGSNATVQAITLTPPGGRSELIFCPWPFDGNPDLVCRWTMGALYELCHRDGMAGFLGAPAAARLAPRLPALV